MKDPKLIFFLGGDQSNGYASNSYEANRQLQCNCIILRHQYLNGSKSADFIQNNIFHHLRHTIEIKQIPISEFTT